jgi:glutamate-1-semialdehyde 2,1-aminomutase
MELFRRASKVIPGGIYGHASPAAGLPNAFPYYAERAKGCRYWDVDGREYLDFMCGYGTISLGYGHPVVEEAAAKQREKGSIFNHPSALMPELAETLTELIEFADWAVFGKNGSDMTTWAIQVAREFSGRKKILKIQGAYHGVDPWCTPGSGGIIEEDVAHIHSFAWNDLEAFQTLVARYRGEVAALIITPFHHPAFGDSEMPAEGFLQQIEKICRKEEILLILDDIRAGFRLALEGSHTYFGFQPDLACYCKALGNGYNISAALGREYLRVAATKVFLTGSYWNDAVSMAASLACLREMQISDLPSHLDKLGQKLIHGLGQAALEHGFKMRFSGPPAMPFMRFAGEKNFFQLQKFCALAAAEGVFLHPHHNWFLCAAHTAIDIDHAIEAATRAFARLANEK